MNIVRQLATLLRHKLFKARRITYFCKEANDRFIPFAESDTTGQIMIPTDVTLEWIYAYEIAVISLADQWRSTRKKVTRTPRWAHFRHAFESHLPEIFRSWFEKYPSQRGNKNYLCF